MLVNTSCYYKIGVSTEQGGVDLKWQKDQTGIYIVQVKELFCN